MEKKILKDVKKGEYIQLTANGPVWVRGEYCRIEKKYELQSADDINRFAYRKGTVFVFVGFTY